MDDDDEFKTKSARTIHAIDQSAHQDKVKARLRLLWEWIVEFYREDRCFPADARLLWERDFRARESARTTNAFDRSSKKFGGWIRMNETQSRLGGK